MVVVVVGAAVAVAVAVGVGGVGAVAVVVGVGGVGAVAVVVGVVVAVGVAVVVVVAAGMSNRERRKGLEGEREVATIWRSHGFEVRGLEGEGDHLVAVRPSYYRPVPVSERNPPTHTRIDAVTLHSEVKRQNRLRTEWIAQAEREAPADAVPVVAWRPDHGRWWAMVPLEDLARLLA